MDGFVMGLAVFVAVGQLNKLFGLPKPEGNTVQKFFGIIRELPVLSSLFGAPTRT
jgi:MFS superfamily sulfate permease-like transporter